jgi:hypothetical protein
MVKLNDVLNEIEQLSLEDQEYLLEVISKRIIESKRHYLLERSKQAEEAYKNGEVFGGTSKELLEFLNDEVY